MENQKFHKLLKLFDHNAIRTSSEIGLMLHVSDRTIRTYMKEFNSLIKEYGGTIIAKPGIGYALQMTDKDAYALLIEQYNQDNQSPETSEERIAFIIEYLLLNKDERISADELANRLYVSKATIISDIKQVKKQLKPYHLDIVYENKEGYMLDGSEFSYRLCVANYLRCDIEDEHEKIKEILLSTFYDMDYHMSDFSLNNLITHIYIAINRIKSQCYVFQLDEDDTNIKDKNELANKLIERLQDSFHIRFPKAETDYIAIHLASKEIVQENVVVDEKVFGLSERMIALVKESFNIDLSNNIGLKMVLAMHLIPLSTRIKYDMMMHNPMLQQIQENYGLAYAMAKIACTVLERKYHREIKEDEIGYIALHFNLALEYKKKVIKKLNVVIVCATGRGSAELMAYNFKRNFMEYIDEIETCEASMIHRKDLTRFDYVISTVNITHKIIRPILQVNYFLENKDIVCIQELFQQRTNTNIETFFMPSLFFSEGLATHRDEAIQWMVNATNSVVELPSDYYNLLMQREANGTTEFGNLVAIPHPCKIITETTFVSIGILKEPIIWNFKKVQFILMLSLGKDHVDLKDFYEVISRLLLDKRRIDEVIKRKDFGFFMKMLHEILRNMEEQ